VLSRYSELAALCPTLPIPDPASRGRGHLIPLWTPSPFDRDTFAWVGGSVFGSLKGNVSRYLMREEYLAIRPRGASEEHSPSPLPSRRVPDWMSLDPSDWRFYGSVDIQPAPLLTAKTLLPTKGPAIKKKIKGVASLPRSK
jgi:hypothetical protein